MITKRERFLPKGPHQGRREVTVILQDGESLMAIRSDSFYRLGGQLDEVVGSHVVEDAVPVTWCSIEQKWVS